MDHKSLRNIMDQPHLNMKQRKWLDVDKDYKCEIIYHPGKVNVVADAFSQKSVGLRLGRCVLGYHSILRF